MHRYREISVFLLQHLLLHLWGFKEHLPLVHRDLVGTGLRRPEEYDVLIREGLQWFGFAPLVHRHVLSADAQPEVVRETTFLALEEEEDNRK